MKITPLDIHQKKFKTAFKGYSINDVDKFLDEISAQLDELFRENTSMKEQITESETVVNKYKGLEQAMNKALINAGKLADEITENAKKEAGDILTLAKEEARKILETSNDQRKELLRNIKKLQKIDEKCKNRLLTTLEEFTKEINMTEPVIEISFLDAEDKVTAQLEDLIGDKVDGTNDETPSEESESSEIKSNEDIIHETVRDVHVQDVQETKSEENFSSSETEEEKDKAGEEASEDSEEKDIVFNVTSANDVSGNSDAEGSSTFADLGEGVPGVIRRKRKQGPKQ